MVFEAASPSLPALIAAVRSGAFQLQYPGAHG